MKNSSFIPILISSVLISCNEKKPRSKNENLFINKQIIVKEEAIKNDIGRFLEKPVFIPLESGGNSLIGEIDLIQILNDTLILFDNNNDLLLTFDLQGNFIRKIGKKGNGPGEYHSASRFSIDPINNHLLIFDLPKHNLMRYTLSGEFIDSEYLEIWPYHFFALGEDIMFFTNGTPHFFNESIYFDLITVRKNKVVNKYFEYDIGTNRWFNPHYPFYLLGDSLNFIKTWEGEVYQYNGNGELMPKIKLDFNGNNIPIHITKSEALFDENKDKYSYIFQYFVETSNYIYFDFMRNGEYLYAIYSKKNKTVIVMEPASRIFESFIFRPRYAYQDTFISVLNPSLLLQANKRGHVINDKLKMIADSTEFASNPILVLHKLKDF